MALHLHLPGSQSGGMPSTVRISHPHLAHEEHWVHSIVNVHRGHLIFLVSGVDKGTVLLAAGEKGRRKGKAKNRMYRETCLQTATN